MGIFDLFKKKKEEPPRDHNKELLDKIIKAQRELYGDKIIKAQRELYGDFPEPSKSLQSELREKTEKTRIEIQKVESSLPEDPPKLKKLWKHLLSKWIAIHRTSGYNGYGYFLGADPYSIHYFNALYGKMEMNRSHIFSIREGDNIYMNSEELPIQGYTTPLIEKLFP